MSDEPTLADVDAAMRAMMMSAAQREGLTIGAWINARMKEAVERSLGNRLAHLPTDLSEERAEAVLIEVAGDWAHYDRAEILRAMQQYAAGLQGENQRLREALLGLEHANEQLASQRSMTTYDAILKDGSAEALLSLDAARKRARTALGDTQ